MNQDDQKQDQPPVERVEVHMYHHFPALEIRHNGHDGWEVREAKGDGQ